MTLLSPRSKTLHVTRLRKSGRVFARQGLDWSERRNHLAGALEIGPGWVERVRENRAVRITELGYRELKHRLGVAYDS